MKTAGLFYSIFYGICYGGAPDSYLLPDGSLASVCSGGVNVLPYEHVRRLTHWL